MGKRSRKRASGTSAPGETTRAERDAARRERALRERAGKPPPRARRRRVRPTADERPKAPWHPVPLSEILTFAGLVLLIWGFFRRSDGSAMMAAGLAVASIGGLELAIREHVTGFRSHTTLLAGALAVVVVIGISVAAGTVSMAVLAVAVAVFVGAFYLLRELFKRRSGGLSFR